MRKITLSALRRNLPETVDAVLANGRPVEVQRHGRRLRLVPEICDSKLARLKPRALIHGRAEDLTTLKAVEWRAPEIVFGPRTSRQFAKRS
jgi:antitoxin (DNA-binding transcriptional repressor) of toxin-antitoxin stability system